MINRPSKLGALIGVPIFGGAARALSVRWRPELEQTFNLLRYFSAASAVIVVVMALGLGGAYRGQAVSELVAAAEVQNVGLAQSFSNTIWPRFSSHVTAISDADGGALRAHPQTRRIHEAVQILTAGTPVLKVKIYDVDGLTVYSSDAGQIGDDASEHRGFVKAARDGTPASKLSYRDTFSAFSGVVEDRALSWKPISRSARPMARSRGYSSSTPT